MKRKRKDKKKRKRKRAERDKNEEKVTSKSSEVIFPCPCGGTDANGKFWCDLSTYNRRENTVRKKNARFFFFLRGQKNRQITCPTPNLPSTQNPSTIIITPQNQGNLNI
jgi:hypothetical protein